MKPFISGNKIKSNFTDCHPKTLGKGWINWWENMSFMKSKKAKRQKDKRDLIKTIND